MPNGNFTPSTYNAWLATVGGYVGLHFDNPETAGYETSEYTGGGYARDTVTWTTPSNKTMWNSNTLAYSGLVAGTVTYLAGWSALTGGSCQWWVQIPGGGRTLTLGAGLSIAPSEIVLSFP